MNIDIAILTNQIVLFDMERNPWKDIATDAIENYVEFGYHIRMEGHHQMVLSLPLLFLIQ